MTTAEDTKSKGLLMLLGGAVVVGLIASNLQASPDSKSGGHPAATHAHNAKPTPSPSRGTVKVMFRVEYATNNFWTTPGVSGSTTYYINGVPSEPHTFDEKDKGGETDDGVDYRAIRVVERGQLLTLQANFRGTQQLYTVAYIRCTIYLLDKHGLHPRRIGWFYRPNPQGLAATHCTAQAKAPTA